MHDLDRRGGGPDVLADRGLPRPYIIGGAVRGVRNTCQELRPSFLRATLSDVAEPFGLARQINRLSSIVLLVLSLTALFVVLIGLTQPRTPDEGALAHIFQLAIVALVPMTFIFLTTADWT